MYASLLTLLAMAGPSPAFPLAVECAASAERVATLTVGSAELGRITARAGSLRIEGRPGLREIRARGTACASDPRLLEQLRLRTEHEGGEARLSVEMPELGDGWAEDRYAYLDLTVEVPEALELYVTDSSGNVRIERVASLRLDDSSGDVEVSDVRGSVQIHDSSGNVELQGVRGNARLTDSSGDLTVRDVQGDVEVEADSSGEIDISGVGRDVVVRRDSSGSITVTGVRGGFRVDQDGSGSIRYSDVAGRVDVPRR